MQIYVLALEIGARVRRYNIVIRMEKKEKMGIFL
jgi:hypothetical protein